ncbi:hypothetical protein O0L34_g9639 [Tuta absoluta]|nr:hypothetical protein O0L34_g9639 [Tuta absoluta]
MADKEQVIQALRATLISVKGALTIRQANIDYKALLGEPIPYKRLGYATLEKLFLDVPGFKVSQQNGEWYVDAIASQETQHIAAMVSKQKGSKKSVKLSHNNRFPLKKQSSWRKPASSTNYSYNYNNQYSNQYSNQYYRAKGSTPYYNNNYNNKNSYNSKYSKATDTRPQQPARNNKPNDTTRPGNDINRTTNEPTKQYNEHTEKPPAKSSSPPSQRDINAGTEEFKHPASVRTENESTATTGARPSKKDSALQRLSKLRDSLNTISHDTIPLHLPAANNQQNLPEEGTGPVAHVAAAHSLEPPPDSTSSVEKLEWTCRKLGLPQPVYKVHEIRPKRGPPMFDCTCKVGSNYTASSYPDSSPTEDLAKEVVAVKLLAVIESSEAGGLPTSSSSKALAYLADLVSEHEAGLWANTVPHLYREKYGENLPSNWQELVENCPRIIKDRVVNGLLVLLPNNEESAPPAYLDMTLVSDDTIDSELPPLQFPEDDFWNVFITVANSTLEIWFRIIGPQYSDAFETLLADMASYYERYGTSVDKAMIINNAWYAVNLEDGGWQRAKILEIEETTATVFLGDHGDDDVVLLSKVKILEPQFRKLPAQAVLCRLEGCEELAAGAAGAVLAQRRLPGEVLVAAPGVRADPADPSVAVVLYDTSTQRDLNLNKEIASDFCTAGAFTVTQKPSEVEVGCVTEEGRVWVSRAGGAATVRNALALLTAGPYRRPLPAAPQAPAPNKGTLYIVRTLAGDWVRCTIISELDSEGTVRTQLVDSGLILRAPLSSLVPLASFSPVLNDYPYQAIQVRLGAADKAAGSMTKRLRELLLDQRVLCRALPGERGGERGERGGERGERGGAPHVELFVRTGPQNILASVNNAILMEFEYLTA